MACASSVVICVVLHTEACSGDVCQDLFAGVCITKSDCKGSVKDTWFDVVATVVMWAYHDRGGDFTLVHITWACMNWIPSRHAVWQWVCRYAGNQLLPAIQLCQLLQSKLHAQTGVACRPMSYSAYSTVAENCRVWVASSLISRKPSAKCLEERLVSTGRQLRTISGYSNCRFRCSVLDW